MQFDPDMRLAYADDATSLETEVVVVDPETGDRAGFTADNLTTALYFIAAHGLLPVREGIKELATLDHPAISLEHAQQLTEARLPQPAEALEAFRQQNLLPVALYIEVEGDPALVGRYF